MEDVGDRIEVDPHELFQGVRLQPIAVERRRQGPLARLGGIQHEADAGVFDGRQALVVALRHRPANQRQANRRPAECACY